MDQSTVAARRLGGSPMCDEATPLWVMIDGDVCCMACVRHGVRRIVWAFLYQTARALLRRLHGLLCTDYSLVRCGLDSLSLRKQD